MVAVDHCGLIEVEGGGGHCNRSVKLLLAIGQRLLENINKKHHKNKMYASLTFRIQAAILVE